MRRRDLIFDMRAAEQSGTVPSDPISGMTFTHKPVTVRYGKQVWDFTEGPPRMSRTNLGAPAGPCSGAGPCDRVEQVAEAPWSGVEGAVALRFDHPRASAFVLLLG